jgi:predicted  nucleic acid-binding Zn-ribbon protein
MSDETEIEWHREQLAKNRALLDELQNGNTDGADVFPETQSEIERLKAQIAQSELIVAAWEKQRSGS